jgi:flavin-dependent dehydrogenase
MIDLAVVGGGPAGLATAVAARLQGLDVAVLDRARPPIDKACGEGLMPDGVAALRQLGVAVDPRHLHPFGGIRYLDGESVAEGRFPGVVGTGIRRLHLHRALLRRAEEVGVDLRWGVRVTGLIGGTTDGDGVDTDGGPVPARWVVGADGLRSRVRRWAGLDAPPSLHRRFGVRRHYRLAPWSDCVEVHWADGCEAYVTPVAADEVGVAFLWSGWKAGFDDHLGRFPALAEKLDGAEPVSRDRGAGPLRQRVRGVVRGRVALVGDASGYVDAITGEGLALAFHQATALAAAIGAGDLRRYAREHRRIRRVPELLTHLLLAIERRPALRRRTLRALARDPDLFSRLLALHVRALPLHHLVPATAPRLLWRLVWA